MNLICEPKALAESLAGAGSGVLADPDPSACERLAEYTALLDRWNRAQRLVGWRTASELARRGLRDAWTAAAHLAEQVPSAVPIVDLGSGAGLPAVVFAVAFPGREVHLVDVRRKRAAFLRDVVRQLGLSTVSVHHGRVADLRAAGLVEPGAVLSARAFLPPGLLVLEAARWCVGWCLVSSSVDRLPTPWPPDGWRCPVGGHLEIDGSVHSLLTPIS